MIDSKHHYEYIKAILRKNDFPDGILYELVRTKQEFVYVWHLRLYRENVNAALYGEDDESTLRRAGKFTDAINRFMAEVRGNGIMIYIDMRPGDGRSSANNVVE